MNGTEFTGTSLEGKPTVLWFWSPWCPTCKAQVSGVSKLAKANPQVDFVGVGSLDKTDAIATFASDVDPAVTELTDPDGAVWRHFGVTTQST